jgi:two-component system, OmpR family, response regulator
MKVLVVEDDRKLLGFLTRAFTEEGYIVDGCRTGIEAMKQTSAIKYDLIVLDWMLPEQDGLSVCRELRRIGNAVPVLMLTARSDVGEKVIALDGGADDYVTKPFHLDELMARSRALTRRGNGTGDGVVRAGPVVLDQRERRVHVNGVRVELTSREFSLLMMLARNAGRVVSRSEILANVWDMRSDPGSNVIDVHVRNIRDKLGPAAAWLETVRGQGYRFALAEPPPTTS